MSKKLGIQGYLNNKLEFELGLELGLGKALHNKGLNKVNHFVPFYFKITMTKTRLAHYSYMVNTSAVCLWSVSVRFFPGLLAISCTWFCLRWFPSWFESKVKSWLESQLKHWPESRLQSVLESWLKYKLESKIKSQFESQLEFQLKSRIKLQFVDPAQVPARGPA